MQLDIGMVFSSLIGLFLLMGVGWVSVKTKIVPPAASAPMSSLLLKVTLPCTIFSSLATREFDSAFLVDGVIIIVIGLVLFPLYAALSWGISKVLKVPAGRRGIWSFGATFCNNGFMGFPVALALFGEEGLALAVMFGVPFNLLVYTLGVRMVCADCGTDAQPVNLVRTLLSNINIALILSLIFYVGQIPLPEALMTPVKAEALRVPLISKQKSLLPQGALAPDLPTLPAKSFRKFLHRQPDFADTTLCLQNATAGGI